MESNTAVHTLGKLFKKSERVQIKGRRKIKKLQNMNVKIKNASGKVTLLT